MLGARMPAPQPLMRMVCRPAGPQAPPTQLVVFGDQQPPGPRPPAAPHPLTAAQVHATPFNVPPPRQLPRQFSHVDRCTLHIIYR